MTIDDKIKDEKLQYETYREAAKILAVYLSIYLSICIVCIIYGFQQYQIIISF